MEAVLHHFYEHLEREEILGRRCQRCGTVAFPPRGICTCGCVTAEWVQMSGQGRLISASAGIHLLSGKQFLLATVKLDEGPIVPGVLLLDDFDFSRPEAVWGLTGTDLRVCAEVRRSEDGGVMVAFRGVGNWASNVRRFLENR